ncbi:MAG: T9SS type B sorting domain-containing protein [Flavobacterium sp.]|nr:T9SS type B sorting domain-containing protein [Flavobacterium sp.]
MEKLIKSLVCLFLIFAFSNANVLAKGSIKNYASETVATAPPTVTTPIYLCQNSVATPLTAMPSGGGTLNWYLTNAPAEVPSATAPTPITTSVGSTNYYVTQTIAGVESTPRTPIVVNVVADNGAFIVGYTCDPSQILPADKNSSVFFDWGNSLLIPDNSYNYTYTTTGGLSGSDNTTVSHLQVFGMLPGQSATIVVTAATHPCATQTWKCTVPCATTTTPTFGTTPTSYCLNDVVVLPTTSTNGISGTWSPIPVDTSTMGTTIYTFTPNPTSFPCSLKTTLSISVEPIVPDFNNFSLCSGDVAPTLSPISPNGITGVWNPLTVDNMNSASYVFTPNIGQPCTPSVKTIDVTVNPSNTLLSLNWTVTDAFTKNQIVTVTNPVGANYFYQMDSGPFQTSSIFENVASGMHSITVKDVNGCSELTNNNVLVIGYPKYFTPNGDTYNDYWNIYGLKDQPDTRIYIFDRYGKLLKDISPIGLGWDGTYIGKPMPADDYWFTVEYLEQNISKKFKSHFSLKR